MWRMRNHSEACGQYPGMNESTDDDVIAASQHAPPRFGEIFSRHWVVVRAYLVRRVGVDLGEELAAEVFVRAFDRRAAYRPGAGDARPWLFGIAANLIREHRRRERRQLRALARMPCAPYGADPADRGDVARLIGELARMPLGTREAVALWVWGDLTYEQIAQALDIPIGTVRSRIARARVRLIASLPDLHPVSPQPLEQPHA
jgi:RNA polymerase sigma factor (sigma-70 family)